MHVYYVLAEERACNRHSPHICLPYYGGLCRTHAGDYAGIDSLLESITLDRGGGGGEGGGGGAP